MNQNARFLILIALCYEISVIMPAKSMAQTGSVNYITENLPQLRKFSAQLNQNVLPLLALIKEYEKYGQPPAFKVAKIIRAKTAIKETDNLSSLTIIETRINEEYPVIDERDNWYEIRTPDNRVGWVQEESVQILMKQPENDLTEIKKGSGQETSALLIQIARYKNIIDELYAASSKLTGNVEREYNGLSPEGKKSIAADYKSFRSEKDKIEKYYQYAIKYLTPYQNLLSSLNAPQSVEIEKDRKFNGTVSADIGQSSYLNSNRNSTTSRRLAFDGNYQIDKATRLNLLLNHQNELIQTAFMSNNIEAGISRQFANKLLLRGNVGYNNYDDKVSDDNSFGQLRAGLNTLFTPSKKISFTGNVNFQSKDFSGTVENNYKSVIYAVGTNILADSKNNIRILIQGNTQFSDKDFLSLNQISPQFIYTHKKSPDRAFSIDLDYDQLKYTGTNNFNDYGKYKAAFQWRNYKKSRTLTNTLDMAYKQHPNNGRQDYFRIGHRTERRKGSLRDENSSVSSFHYMVTVITMRENNNLTDYLDLRWDKSKLRPKWYSNSNFYLKMLNNFEMMINDSSNIPDHYIDFYKEFGPSFRNNSDRKVKITRLNVGLILGGHFYFNFDEDYFNRNGNSLRGGLALNSTINIVKASLVLSGSYERSVLICKETSYDSYSGNIIYGDNIYRRPSSFQFNIDFQQPIKNNWDIHFNLGTYNIWTDATFETSINPVDRKSSLRFSGGLIYRFAL